MFQSLYTTLRETNEVLSTFEMIIREGRGAIFLLASCPIKGAPPPLKLATFNGSFNELNRYCPRLALSNLFEAFWICRPPPSLVSPLEKFNIPRARLLFRVHSFIKLFQYFSLNHFLPPAKDTTNFEKRFPRNSFLPGKEGETKLQLKLRTLRSSGIRKWNFISLIKIYPCKESWMIRREIEIDSRNSNFFIHLHCLFPQPILSP